MRFFIKVKFKYIVIYLKGTKYSDNQGFYFKLNNASLR